MITEEHSMIKIIEIYSCSVQKCNDRISTRTRLHLSISTIIEDNKKTFKKEITNVRIA